MRIDQAGTLKEGDILSVTIGAIESARATVIWIENGSAGLSFEVPIDQDAAYAKVAIKPPPTSRPLRETGSAGPTAGWLPSRDDPYRK